MGESAVFERENRDLGALWRGSVEGLGAKS